MWSCFTWSVPKWVGITLLLVLFRKNICKAVAHVCQWDWDMSKWEGSQEALTWYAWKDFLSSHPGGWPLWQGRVIRLLGDLVTGYGVCSIPCRTQAGRGGQYHHPSCLACAVCIICALSASGLHCQKTERKDIRGSIPLSVGINAVVPERNVPFPPHPFSPLRFTCLYICRW